jgi:hypothetical protein
VATNVPVSAFAAGPAGPAGPALPSLDEQPPSDRDANNNPPSIIGLNQAFHPSIAMPIAPCARGNQFTPETVIFFLAEISLGMSAEAYS